MSKTYLIDIDQTICHTPERDGVRDYNSATPILCRISKINQLYDSGNTIKYWTSRGASTGLDWDVFTYNQLKSWGCKFHSCECGKPSYDVWIDDKAINDKDFFNEK